MLLQWFPRGLYELAVHSCLGLTRFGVLKRRRVPPVYADADVTSCYSPYDTVTISLDLKKQRHIMLCSDICVTFCGLHDVLKS